MSRSDTDLFTPAYVLHRRPYREHDLLIDLFSAEHGRLRAIARRARSRRSQHKALLQPFYPLLIQLTGQGELKTLRSAEAAGPMLQLPGEQLYAGLYLNELLIRATGTLDPYPELFAVYSHTVGQLAQRVPMEPALRRFEFQLLEQLGYGLDFSEVVPGGYYCYVAGQGMRPVAAGAHGSLAGEALLGLATDFFGPDPAHGLVHGSGHETEHNPEYNPDSLATARLLLRSALKPLLGNKPLQSRELLIQTRKLRRD